VVLDHIDPGVALLKLEGEHDLSTVEELQELLERVQENRAPVVIDVSEATFIDSSILAAMVAAHRRAQDERIGLTVCMGSRAEEGGSGEVVQRVLDITGLEKHLQVHSRREEAVAAAKRGLL
jgi:anti-sigma B factor antagonist